MSTLALALRQVRYEDLAFRRNPISAFFTVVFPLIFLVIFNLLFGNEQISFEGGTARASTFFIPAIAALALISACYTNLAIMISVHRGDGLLKRFRGSPLPTWAYLLGRIIHVTLVALAMVAVVVAAGWLFYGVDVPTNTLPAFVLTLVLGAAVFCALGMAVSGLIPNADAAPAVTNGTILPLMFISDIFLRLDDAPRWLELAGDLFPVKHLSLALQTAFDPFEQGYGFEPLHLAVMAAWGLGATVVALRFFSWEPRV